MSATFTFRQKIGALAFDAPRFLWATRGPAACGAHWTRYGNRRDRLVFEPQGRGVACDWEFTRTLHLCDVFPGTGRKLMAVALRDCPIRFAEVPEPSASDAGAPDVSFIIGHRGAERLPLLLRVLKSIAAQQGIRVECIVAEQDVAPQVRDRLPEWVRYVHVPGPSPESPYSRSRAFNAGAAMARGRALVLHDNDLLVPAGYAMEAVRLVQAGHEVINHKRFIFYLSEAATDEVLANGRLDARAPLFAPTAVLENATGGGSLAMDRAVFEALGRMDGSFVGWGGEDVEFWQRARTRRVWNYGFLPLVHLWHPAQPGKTPEKKTPGMERLRQLSDIPPEERIRALRQAHRGLGPPPDTEGRRA